MVKWCFIFAKAQKSSLSFMYSIVALIIYLYFYIERMSFMEKIINWLRIVLAEEKSSKLTLNVLK